MPTELFTPSTFAPLAIGFFGLGTGYFVWGDQAVFGFPSEDKPDVSQTMGMWRCGCLASCSSSPALPCSSD